MFWSGLRVRITLMRFRIPLFIFMPIRIRLFTFPRTPIRILTLIRVMRICDLWSSTAPFWASKPSFCAQRPFMAPFWAFNAPAFWLQRNAFCLVRLQFLKENSLIECHTVFLHYYVNITCFSLNSVYRVQIRWETLLCHAPLNPVLNRFTDLSLEINHIHVDSRTKTVFHASNRR